MSCSRSVSVPLTRLKPLPHHRVNLRLRVSLIQTQVFSPDVSSYQRWVSELDQSTCPASAFTYSKPCCMLGIDNPKIFGNEPPYQSISHMHRKQLITSSFLFGEGLFRVEPKHFLLINTNCRLSSSTQGHFLLFSKLKICTEASEEMKIRTGSIFHANNLPLILTQDFHNN